MLDRLMQHGIGVGGKVIPVIKTKMKRPYKNGFVSKLLNYGNPTNPKIYDEKDDAVIFLEVDGSQSYYLRKYSYYGELIASYNITPNATYRMDLAFSDGHYYAFKQATTYQSSEIKRFDKNLNYVDSLYPSDVGKTEFFNRFIWNDGDICSFRYFNDVYLIDLSAFDIILQYSVITSTHQSNYVVVFDEDLNTYLFNDKIIKYDQSGNYLKYANISSSVHADYSKNKQKIYSLTKDGNITEIDKELNVIKSFTVPNSVFLSTDTTKSAGRIFLAKDYIIIASASNIVGVNYDLTEVLWNLSFSERQLGDSAHGMYLNKKTDSIVINEFNSTNKVFDFSILENNIFL